jgi:hypothetical protein
MARCIWPPTFESSGRSWRYASIGVMKSWRPLPPINHFDVGQDDILIDRVS